MARNPTAALRTIRPRRAGAAERAHGFTLLEILVVVLVVGIVFSLAIVAFRDDIDERLKTEAQRLAALLTLAGQEAVLQAREVAVVFTPQGYRFQLLDEGKWVDSTDRMFRPRQLAEDMTLLIEIEGYAVKAAPDAEEEPPRIYLLSSGEMTPFELSLKHKHSTATYQLRGDISGELLLGS